MSDYAKIAGLLLFGGALGALGIGYLLYRLVKRAWGPDTIRSKS